MRIVLLCALLSLVPLFAMDNLPECYHTYDEITEILFQLEESYPNIAKVHMIGYSQEENLPIYAMQISANVEATWERPALLFVGQVHAEEVLGVEITLSNIQEILNNQYQVPYSSWINQLDSWWIPTLNPEGHNVVTSNLDTSYRKNKRDNNNNGVFDYSSLVGYDIDGVDINRNFDFNWTHGDTLKQPGGTEVYDYYRGPSPMSESEIIAIKQLADAKKFIYSICWHSSRSGNFSEKVYYSFNWKDVRPSPDFAFAQSIAQGVASQIQKESAGTYEYYPNASRRGAFHDWMYKEYGTIQLLIEVGTRNLQPNEALMLDTIQRATNGVWWMMNRALRFSTNVASSSLLTGQFTDSVTGDPLQAELIIEQKHAPWFVARTSFADTGRYWKALPQGSYTLRVRKEGYWDKVLEYVNVNNSSWTTRNIALDPKETTLMHGYVTSSGTNIPAQMIIKDISPDTLSFEGHYIYHGYEGEYPIEIFSDGYYPYLGTLTLEPGTVQQSYNLSPATTLFSETWENGSDAWTNSGEWVLQNELSSSGYAITDSWGGRGHYAQNCDVHIATVNPIALPIAGNPLLYFDSHLYTEWDHDPVTVEISLDNESWTELWTKSGRHDFWQREYIDLSEYAGNEVYLRFRLRDSSIADELTDPGWTIDNIYVITGVATSLIDQLVPGIEKSVLYPNFPNPFNPETTIRYSLAASSKVELDIFNIRGQKVRSYHPGMQAAGNYRFIFDGMDDAGQSLASGIYFYRMKTGDLVQSRKMILMK